MVINGSMVVAKQWNDHVQCTVLNYLKLSFGMFWGDYTLSLSLLFEADDKCVKDSRSRCYQIHPKIGHTRKHGLPHSKHWITNMANCWCFDPSWFCIYLLLYHESIWIVYVQLHGFSILNTPQKPCSVNPPIIFCCGKFTKIPEVSVPVPSEPLVIKRGVLRNGQFVDEMH